jgi:AcrR family transcriptional regulator
VSVDTARRPNRRGEGVRLRGEILGAAAAILDETGDEHAVTLRAVARRAGIAAPSIYAHFPDRQAILLAVVQDAFADLARHLQPAADPAVDAVHRLRATCDAYLAYAAAHPQRYRLMFDGVWDGAEAVAGSSVTAAEVTHLGQDALGALADRLRACVDAETSTSTDVEADAVALWLGLHGLAHQRAVAPGFPWPDDIGERVVDALARLVPRGASSPG